MRRRPGASRRGRVAGGAVAWRRRMAWSAVAWAPLAWSAPRGLRRVRRAAAGRGSRHPGPDPPSPNSRTTGISQRDFRLCPPCGQYARTAARKEAPPSLVVRDGPRRLASPWVRLLRTTRTTGIWESSHAAASRGSGRHRSRRSRRSRPAGPAGPAGGYPPTAAAAWPMIPRISPGKNPNRIVSDVVTASPPHRRRPWRSGGASLAGSRMYM